MRRGLSASAWSRARAAPPRSPLRSERRPASHSAALSSSPWFGRCAAAGAASTVAIAAITAITLVAVADPRIDLPALARQDRHQRLLRIRAIEVLLCGYLLAPAEQVADADGHVEAGEIGRVH